MREPVYTAELDHDSQGFTEEQLKPYLEQAMDSLIDDLFEGKSVGGLHLDAYVEKFSGEIAAKLITGEMTWLETEVKYLIRRELTDSYLVSDRAAELAQEE